MLPLTGLCVCYPCSFGIPRSFLSCSQPGTVPRCLVVFWCVFSCLHLLVFSSWFLCVILSFLGSFGLPSFVLWLSYSSSSLPLTTPSSLPSRPLLKDAKKSGVTHVVLDVEREKIFTVLKQAQQIGMMTSYHNYFITSMVLSSASLLPCFTSFALIHHTALILLLPAPVTPASSFP